MAIEASESDPLVAPHAASLDQVVEALDTDAHGGLTAGEAAARLESVGPNELDEAPPTPWWERLAEQFRSPLIYLLAVAIVISVIAWGLEGADGVPLDAIVIVAILVANAAIGFVQEAKAEQAVAELRRMVSATATVYRDGSPREVAAADIVPGDIVALHEGDTVPADGRLLDCAALAIGEAVLTGESEAVFKTLDPVEVDASLGDRTNMAFAATAVNAGSGRMVVTSTGMSTQVGDIASLLHETEHPPTPLEREMAQVGRVLGIAVVVLCLVVVGVTSIVSGVESLEEAVELLLIGVSLAVAAVPEGLPAVLSIVLAMGVRRMANRNALLKRLAFAETLGSTTVICSDKTGTLTRNEMSVRRMVADLDEFTFEGEGYDPSGSVQSVAPEASPGDGAVAALEAAVLACDADVQLGDEGWAAVGDPTEAALIVAARRGGIDVAALRGRARRVAEIPFDSARKRMSTLTDVGTDRELVLVTKGAPEVVLPRCARHGTLDESVALDQAARTAWTDRIDGYGDRALRTLAIAARRMPTAPVDGLGEDDEGDLTLLGVVGIMDPPRPEVGPAVDTAQQAGIKVMMITGDHPRTASRIATEVGIAGAESGVVTGAEIDASGEPMSAHLDDVTVFSRVAPRHKLELVEALQERGHVVAMTGDGVNDAPALKAADIGVAMGRTGSGVSKGAADMILTDDNFATIVASVEDGRGIFSNIASFMRFLLSSNMGEVLVMFLGVVFASVIGLEAGEEGIVAPLVATQILWINLLTDTGPALALGRDPVDPAVMQERPRQPGDRLIDRQMISAIAVFGLTMAVATLFMLDFKLPGGLIEGDSDLETARTAAFTVLVLTQLFNAYNTRSDRRSAFYRPLSNPWLVGAIALSFLLQVMVVHVPALHDAFGTTSLSFQDWVGCVIVASSVLWVGEIRHFVRRRRAATA